MKKTIFILATIAASLVAAAQTGEGNWLAGGSASFISQKETGQSQSSTLFTFAPNAGYFFADNLAIGAAIQFQSTSGYSSFIGAPFVRYYFLPLGDNAKLFGQGSFGFGSASSGSQSRSSTAWSISAGPAFFLNQNIAIETAFNYGQTKVKDFQGSYSAFGFNVGFQIHLGSGIVKKK